jgi:hypothetical protein
MVDSCPTDVQLSVTVRDDNWEKLARGQTPFFQSYRFEQAATTRLDSMGTFGSSEDDWPLLRKNRWLRRSVTSEIPRAMG